METLRESPRLKTFDYRGHHAYFVTSVTRQRRPVFVRDDLLDLAEPLLLEIAEKFAFELASYCFMPDHLHLLAIGQSRESDLQGFVRQFKQRTSYHSRSLIGAELWQISYPDRVLRSCEAVPDVARYIWENPVRAGLASDYLSYRWSGPRPLPDQR
jgi:REP element-mobilizing transposase RayT